MARPAAARYRGVVAGATSFMLALVAGFVFAGTGQESEPPLAVRDQAQHAAAVRIALSGGDPESVAPPAAGQSQLPVVQQLLPDAEHVLSIDSATRIRIASVGIDAEVRTVGFTFEQGRLQYDTPRVEAGQYVGSAAPGEVGNTVIGGHVATRSGAAVFEHLPEVSVGDTIEVYRGDELYRYEISELRRVDPDATEVMSQTSDARVTLITCYPDDNFSQRFVVVGKLIS